MGLPVLLVVDEDQAVLEALSGDLGRRFGLDYQILAESSPTQAVTVLQRLATDAQPVALIFAGQQLTEMPAVEFLVAAHGLHPAAKRILRLERGDYTAANPAVQAMTLGQIDYHLFTPWLPAERWLYPPVSDFLADWSRTQPPSFVAFRIVGRQWEPSSHRLREILTRLAFPYRFYPHDSDEGRRLLAEAGQDGRRLPVMVFRTGQVLVDPSHAELTTLLGGSTRPQAGRYDLAIVGAGPAGLTAAVSAASEGLRTLVVEPEVFGGQAGTSSLIRNYPGHPHGISGDDLAIATFEQAWLFGTNFVFAQAVTGLTARGDERLLRLLDGSQVAGQQVFVVGGGNSAGQAAVHLAEYAATVTILVRGAALGATMSDYLVKKIEATPNITVQMRTEVVDGHGRGRLEELTLRDRDRGTTETVAAAALFVLIGGEPRTDWLQGVVACDRHGYVLTGRDLPADDAATTVAGCPAAAVPGNRPARGVRRRRRAPSVRQARGLGRRRGRYRRPAHPPVPRRTGDSLGLQQSVATNCSGWGYSPRWTRTSRVTRPVMTKVTMLPTMPAVWMSRRCWKGHC